MIKSFLTIALAASLGISPAGACGLDGVIDNPFTTSYPGSLGVALGTQRAVISGQLPALPELDAEAAHERLEERLDQLRARLEKANLKSGFALFVVESGHWARFEAKGGSVRIAAHTAPANNEPVLLTSEAALAALLDGHVSAESAGQAGLVRWTGMTSPVLTQILKVALATGV